MFVIQNQCPLPRPGVVGFETSALRTLLSRAWFKGEPNRGEATSVDARDFCVGEACGEALLETPEPVKRK